MQARIKIIISSVALGLTLLVNTVPSWAGLTSVVAVEVDPGDGASGTVSAARYSSDRLQNIGCIVHRAPAYTVMNCFAEDKDQHSVVCGTSDPNLVAVADAITDYSFIHFTLKPGTGNCGSVLMINSSAFLH